jgi:hypothetical protein
MDCINAVTLVAGNVLFEPSRLMPPVKEDVYNSLLFAQLYADSEFNKYEFPAQWYKEYIEAMYQSKWIGDQHGFRYLEPAEQSRVTIEKLVAENLLTRLHKTRAIDIKKMMAYLGGLPETDAAQVLFRAQVLSVAPATAEAGAVLEGRPISTLTLHVSVMEREGIIDSLFIHFSTTDVIGLDIFHQELRGDRFVGKISLLSFRRELNQVMYAKVRPDILNFLSDQKDKLIVSVPCHAPDVGGEPDGLPSRSRLDL